MSIFSSIGNAVKSAATYTYNTLNSIGSGIYNAIAGTNNSANALQGTYIAPKASYGSPAYYASNTNYNNAIGANGVSAGSMDSGNNFSSTPVTYKSGTNNSQVSSYGSGSSYQSLGGSSTATANNYAPSMVSSPVNFSVNSSGMTGSGTSGSPAVGNGTTAVIMPSAPSVGGATVGNIAQNNVSSGMNPDGTTGVSATTGTATGKDLGYGTNPDGTPKTATQAITEEINARNAKEVAPPSMADAYNRALAQTGQANIQGIVNDLQNRVNAVNTRISTDLQSLRGVGAKEGVTEAVYGQQAAEVTREGNLQLLPLQAQLSAAQGNLDVAKEQTNTLFSIYAKDAQNSVDFYNKQVDALSNAKIEGITKQEAQRLEELKTQKSNDFTILNEQMQSFNTAANAALARGDTGTYKAIVSGLRNVNTNVNSPTFRQDNESVLSNIGNTVVNAVASQVTEDLVATTDSNSGSILSQTGLSIPAFSYLTKGTTALTRLSAADRKKYMQEAADWANKNGVDISTFSSQYDAYNTALQNNIKRFNNTKIMENELLGTIQNLSAVADEKSFGQLKVANVAKLFAGEQVNDSATLQYATHLNQLVSEMAGYNAATQGRTSTDVIDVNEAKRVIQNGISSGSLKGFQNAIESSTSKMGQVLQNSVDNTRKQVWDLFGVGKNYQTEAERAVPVGGIVTVGGKEYKKNSDGTYDMVEPAVSSNTQSFSAALANWFK